jgi:hypothetical protein
MHVLRRSHDLHRAALVAVAAAVLAIVLTLVIAGGLNDLSSTPTAASVPSPHATMHASAIGPQTSNPFTHSPFTSPFTAPVRLRWASGPR